jgi:hypothetical protein
METEKGKRERTDHNTTGPMNNEGKQSSTRTNNEVEIFVDSQGTMYITFSGT